MRFPVTQLLIGILVGHVAYSQTSTPPSFEAASIKQNTGTANGTGTVQILPGGRLRARNALVRAIIQAAYEVKPFEIAGAPTWIDAARYDIEATAASEATPRETLRMAQALLEERFQLRAHRESREVPVYSLSPAKGGLKIESPKEGDCVTPSQDRQPRAQGQSMQVPCGRVMARIELPHARLQGARVDMAELTRVLSNLLWRPVLDRTGYAAKFDMKVDFPADDALGILAGPYRPDTAPPIPAEPGAVSIFTAFQDQLGIKIAADKGPVIVLVIDRIEKPSAN